jgi:DNA-binding transcriptional LysR family regulator
MRRGHPVARRKLTAEQFAALAHLEISSSGEDTGFVDGWLASRGVKRSIVHRAPYLSAASILARSDMVATLSRRIAEAFLRREPLQTRGDLPCPSPRVSIGMLWHRRLDNQPAHRWLRSLIETVCKRL